jgi:RimJ/RimL family protein N-acetyltransferase
MLHGEHVVLRAVTEDDYGRLYRWAQDPDIWAQTTDKPLRARSFAEFTEYYDRVVRNEATAEFAVDVDDTLIGRATLFAFDNLAQNAELGVSLGPEYRGKGYGRDVVRVLLRYGFHHRNLHRIWLETLATNEAGLRAYRAAGFVEEGRLREQAWSDGAHVDVVRMAVLRRDWYRIASEP